MAAGMPQELRRGTYHPRGHWKSLRSSRLKNRRQTGMSASPKREIPESGRPHRQWGFPAKGSNGRLTLRPARTPVADSAGVRRPAHLEESDAAKPRRSRSDLLGLRRRPADVRRLRGGGRDRVPKTVCFHAGGSRGDRPATSTDPPGSRDQECSAGLWRSKISVTGASCSSWISLRPSDILANR